MAAAALWCAAAAQAGSAPVNVFPIPGGQVAAPIAKDVVQTLLSEGK